MIILDLNCSLKKLALPNEPLITIEHVILNVIINFRLPNLLQMLTINGNTSKIEQYSYNNETHSLITVLVSTFNLSAANVVFKTAEWTLVGLIIIKM